MFGNYQFRSFAIAATALLASSAAWAADGDPWSVSKSSGEVWLMTPGVQQTSLGNDNELKPGDTIRTGRNGRVLLTRGAETMLIAPNSEIDVPKDARDGMGTTILQRAGSILLDVEHQNVKHFEVETPYLAAVVKGTQFRVTIASGSTKVDVSRGQVEVSDFKSGQIAQVTPGQSATSFAHGQSGIHLSGAGTFAPIEQGQPRSSTIQRVPVPKDGLHAPREAKGAAVHVVGPVNAAPSAPAALRPGDQRQGAATMPKSHGVHISTTLGEVKLNVSSATHGLAHNAVVPGQRNGGHKDTIWSDNKSAVAGNSGSGSSGSSNGSSSANSGAAAISASVAAAVGSANAFANAGGGSNSSGAAKDNGSSHGNGNAYGSGNGNGNGHRNGNEGHGNGNGHGNGADNGNGHGSGNGNGHH